MVGVVDLGRHLISHHHLKERGEGGREGGRDGCMVS